MLAIAFAYANKFDRRDHGLVSGSAADDVRRRHERRAVDHAARMKGGKLSLRPTQRLDRRAVEQQFGGRVDPDDPIDQIIGPIGDIGDAIAIEIERRVVAPVIAAAMNRPVERARPDIFHLIAVVDEGVLGDDIMLGAGGEMDADFATLEPIASKLVEIRIVDEDAFLAAMNDGVVLYHRMIGVVEQYALVTVAFGAVAPHDQTIGIHQGQADMVAISAVEADFAVVGIHVMNGETHVVEHIAAEDVPAAVGDEYPVLPHGDVIVFNARARRIPDIHAVAGFARAQIMPPTNDVAPNDAVLGAPHHDSDKIVLETQVLDRSRPWRSGQEKRRRPFAPDRCRNAGSSVARGAPLPP